MTALFALLTSLMWGLADFGGGLLTRRLPGLAVIVISQTAAALLLVVAVTASGGWGDGGVRLWFAVGAGVVGPVAMLAFYRALALGPMGVVSPLSSTAVLVPISVGLALGERPGTVQLTGIGVAGLGILLAGGPQLGGGQPVHRQTVLLALVAAAGFGTVLALISHATDPAAGTGTAALPGLFLALLVQRACNIAVGGAALAVSLRRGRTAAGAVTEGAGPAASAGQALQAGQAGQAGPAEAPAADVLPAGRPLRALRAIRHPKLAPALLLVGAGDVAANGTYVLATQSGPVAVAAVLASLFPVVTALAARLVLRERLRPVQAAGAGLAVIGTVLLAAH
ncbi:DMT family transporter [Phaeacidiphilus oryzae]|uniref:DMT family transporter n=1 Tax=Phaeacidiphilus oryzae TaxID=348818 RepID=UPI00055E97C1|nr:DMT family transporter [Phaeacidiphilus oryzae]